VTFECVAASAAVMSAVDPSVDPCSDFFQVIFYINKLLFNSIIHNIFYKKDIIIFNS